MKKIILSLCVLGLLTGTAMAACNGGTMRGGFCVSNVRMHNWWSAATWCQANGGSLATIYDACPDWDGNIGDAKCGRVIDSSWGEAVWVSTVSGTSNAYFVYLGGGLIGNRDTRAAPYYHALCK